MSERTRPNSFYRRELSKSDIIDTVAQELNATLVKLSIESQDLLFPEPTDAKGALRQLADDAREEYLSEFATTILSGVRNGRLEPVDIDNFPWDREATVNRIASLGGFSREYERANPAAVQEALGWAETQAVDLFLDAIVPDTVEESLRGLWFKNWQSPESVMKGAEHNHNNGSRTTIRKTRIPGLDFVYYVQNEGDTLQRYLYTPQKARTSSSAIPPSSRQ